MRGVRERPAGLRYEPGVLSLAEERGVLSVLAGLKFDDVVMHGRAARRTVRHFGFSYEYETGRIAPGEPPPPALRALRDRCAALAAVRADQLAQILVTRYPTGATIGWHRDAPTFGPVVVGVSLLSACTMRFQRRVGDERRVFALTLEPRSVYVLAGAARAVWQHSIPPVSQLRYSVTFRTLRQPAG
jgi:alkylated DNA repair protein (DNA oxidative demethylase)